MRKFLTMFLGAALLSLGVSAAAFALAPQQTMGLNASGPGLSDFHMSSAATTNATLVKASPGAVYTIIGNNTISATIEYLHLYNGAASPTCSATTNLEGTYTLPAAAITKIDVNSFYGESFPAGIGFCLTAAAADGNTTVAATGVFVDVLYQ